MPSIGDVVKYRSLGSDATRVAVVTAVDGDTVGLAFLTESISGQGPYVADEASGYEPLTASEPAKSAAPKKVAS